MIRIPAIPLTMRKWFALELPHIDEMLSPKSAQRTSLSTRICNFRFGKFPTKKLLLYRKIKLLYQGRSEQVFYKKILANPQLPYGFLCLSASLDTEDISFRVRTLKIINSVKVSIHKSPRKNALHYKMNNLLN